MTIYIQHGYGKATKIRSALDDATVSGVILSPRDETPTNMEALAAELKSRKGVDVLFDPQFYATTMGADVRDGSLSEYKDYYRGGLTRRNFVSPSDFQSYARTVLGYQMTLGVSRLLSPTVCFEDLQDHWSQIALSLAQASLEHHSQVKRAPPLLISLVFSESLLASEEKVDELLDIISLWGVDGFYLVVRRSDRYRAGMDATQLANLAYLVYSLAEVNEFEVVCGYTDLITLVLHAVGATATASGWHNGLRQFSLARFQPSSGGSRPKDRYTSQPLLTSLYLSELDTIYSEGMIKSVLSHTSYDRRFTAGEKPVAVEWPLEASTLHHWQVLSRLAAAASSGSTSTRLEGAIRLIHSAQKVFNNLKDHHITFDPITGDYHLEQWLEAMRLFRERAKV